MEVLGIDIGGSGIKGAIVDTTNNKLIVVPPLNQENFFQIKLDFLHLTYLLLN